MLSVNQSLFVTPLPSPAFNTPEPQQIPEDDFLISIKLLAHVKKYSMKSFTPFTETTDLVRKSMAVLRRLLNTDSPRSDYTCQMLLSTVLAELVKLIERAYLQYVDGTGGSQFSLDGELDFFNQPAQITGVTERVVLQGLLQQSIGLVAELSLMLKRRPYDGYQTIGRHESLLLDLERRLKTCLNVLS